MDFKNDLTENELDAYISLVKSCLWNMGGSRPCDLEQDELTWIGIDDLTNTGRWTKHEAAGTLGALESKGLVTLDGMDSCLTRQWRDLDLVWDELTTYPAHTAARNTQ